MTDKNLPEFIKKVLETDSTRDALNKQAHKLYIEYEGPKIFEGKCDERTPMAKLIKDKVAPTALVIIGVLVIIYIFYSSLTSAEVTWYKNYYNIDYKNYKKVREQYIKKIKEAGVKVQDPKLITRIPVPGAEQVSRTLTRGTLASIASGIFIGGMNYLFDSKANTNSATSGALVGYLLGSTFNFVCDISVGTDEGFGLIKTHGIMTSLKYAVGNIGTFKFARFIVTVLLDIFISLILLDPVTSLLQSNFCVFSKDPSLTLGVAASLIGMLTFQAYANQTRFLWAYPSENTTDRSLLLPSGAVMLAVVLAGVLFSSKSTGLGHEKDKGINHPDIKIAMLIAVFLLLTGLTMSNGIDPKLKYDIQNKVHPYIKGTETKISPFDIDKYNPDDVEYRVKETVKQNDLPTTGDIINKKSKIGAIIFSAISLFTILGTLSTTKIEGLENNMRNKTIVGAVTIIPMLLFVWGPYLRGKYDEPKEPEISKKRMKEIKDKIISDNLHHPEQKQHSKSVKKGLKHTVTHENPHPSVLHTTSAHDANNKIVPHNA
jgi:hypothetical protein